MTDFERIVHLELKLESASRDKAKLTEALAAARTLLAQQAKRADEAERKAQAHEIDAAAHLRHYHAAQAQAAEMRRALEPFAQMEVSEYATSERHPRGADAAKALYRYMAAISHVHAPGERIVDQSAIWELAQAARAALAISPGDALERVRRETRIEALEALPCHAKGRFDSDCLEFENLPLDLWCPRCRALDAAKGGA